MRNAKPVWPETVPVFDESMICQGLFSRAASGNLQCCSVAWLAAVFLGDEQDYEPDALKYVGADYGRVAAYKRALREFCRAVGLKSSARLSTMLERIIRWTDASVDEGADHSPYRRTRAQIAAALNRTMRRLDYTKTA